MCDDNSEEEGKKILIIVIFQVCEDRVSVVANAQWPDGEGARGGQGVEFFCYFSCLFSNSIYYIVFVLLFSYAFLLVFM